MKNPGRIFLSRLNIQLVRQEMKAAYDIKQDKTLQVETGLS
jgi:hypothetical protein